jgi:N-methylhydantoinase B/oxoprolinase/acetone carboxylase alpha subunit
MCVKPRKGTLLQSSFYPDGIREIFLCAIPYRGVLGGNSGNKGSVFINNKLINPVKQIDLREGDEIVLRLPGGGGFGHPRRE